MKQPGKGLFRLCSIFLAAGLVLTVVGFLMGGRITNMQFEWNNGPRLSYNQGATRSTNFGTVTSSDAFVEASLGATGMEDEIRKLDIEVGGARVLVQAGDRFSLSVVNSSGSAVNENRYQSYIEQGTWHIASHNGIPIESMVFYITVPRSAALKELEVEVGAGLFTLKDIMCETADFSVGAGTMEVQNLTVARDFDIEIGMGSFALENSDLQGNIRVDCGLGTASLQIHEPSEYGYNIDSGLGTVAIGTHRFSGNNRINYNSNAAVFYEIDCGLGSVSIEFY